MSPSLGARSDVVVAPARVPPPHTVRQMTTAVELCHGFQAVRRQQSRLAEMIEIYHKALQVVAKPDAEWSTPERVFVEKAAAWAIPYRRGAEKDCKYGATPGGAPLDRTWCATKAAARALPPPPPPTAANGNADAMCSVLQRAAGAVTDAHQRHVTSKTSYTHALHAAQQQAGAWLGAVGGGQKRAVEEELAGVMVAMGQVSAQVPPKKRFRPLTAVASC